MATGDGKMVIVVRLGRYGKGKKPIACTLLIKLLYDTTLVSKTIISLHVVCMVSGLVQHQEMV